MDRNNLGKQTLNEFQQYVSPYTNRKFTEEYTVQHLKRNTIDPASKVCITTIQRLYSMLKGEEEFLEENEEGSLFEAESSLIKEPLPVVYNPKIPIETFDFIVVDECHRSIYNIWRQVLEYFDAFLIGLTATPTNQTIGFFNGNLVRNTPTSRPWPMASTSATTCTASKRRSPRMGPSWCKEPGVFVPHRDRRTKSKKYKELDNDLTYTANQLDRDVVAENQIRLVVRTFRDKLPEIFPGRTEVPKTLVFAKTDLHAEDIVRIMREEFGKGNDFCQKITSKTTGKKPEDLLAEFRNTLQPPHRRHRGHDRHRHRREAAGMPAVHAEHPVAVLLRADEGPWLPGDRSRRPANASRPTPRQRRTSSSWMPSASARTTRRPRSRWTASPPCRSTRSWTWSLPALPTPIWSRRWRLALPGWTGSSTLVSKQPSPRQPAARTSPP